MINLDVHSIYSKKQSLATIPELVNRAVELEQSALALTDSGGLYGAIEFYKLCKKNKIKPLIGVEINVCESVDTKDRKYFQLILIAKTIDGYRNICKLITESYSDSCFYSVPRVDWKLLEKYSKDVICTLGGTNNPICKPILNDQLDYANYNSKMLSSIFLHFHPQINPISIPKYDDYAKFVVSNFPISYHLTNRIEFIDPANYEYHDMLSCMNGKSYDLLSSKRRIKSNSDNFFKTEEDVIKTSTMLTEAQIEMGLKETQFIADLVDLDFEFKMHFPAPLEAKRNKQFNSIDRFKELLNEGWKYRKHKLTHATLEQYKERIRFEAEVIIRLGYVNYFIVVSDFVRRAKDNGIPCGPGRGSAAGSMCSYLLRITEIDPIEHGLIFERFLDPSGNRVDPPDIDIDFDSDRRQEVIDDLRNKYGEERVASVANLITFAFKASIKDAARTLDVPFEVANEYTRMVPFGVSCLDEAKEDTNIKHRLKTDALFARTLRYADGIRGVMKNLGTHAGGVIITPEELTNYSPIETIRAYGHKRRVVQFDKKSCESMGLLKIDILGLSALSTQRKTIELIHKLYGKKIDIYELDLNDKAIFDAINNGRTAGIFQLEGKGMTNLAVEMQLESLRDVCDLIALYRPQVLKAKLHLKYLENKRNNTHDAIHPALNNILKDTYGVLVYQEQNMQAVVSMAGFSMADADMMRRATGKKTKSDIPILKKKFVEGCIKNGISIEDATEVFSIFEDAGYSFNLSHSLSYAVVACQTAWFRHYYPTEYLTSCFSTEAHASDKDTKFERLAEECRYRGIEILQPCINNSELDFAPENGNIRYGLSAIKEIPNKLCELIIDLRKERKFKDFNDFVSRLSDRNELSQNKSIIEVLIMVGAFDIFGVERNKLIKDTEDKALLSKAINKKRSINRSLFDVFEIEKSYQPVTPMSRYEKKSYELRYLGLSFS